LTRDSHLDDEYGMDGQWVHSPVSGALMPRDPAIRLVQCVIGALTCGLLLLALFLLVRRLEGAMVRPLAAPLLVLMALILATTSAAMRRLWPLPWDRLASQLVLWVPAISLLILAASLTLADSHPVALIAAWTILASEEVVWLWIALRRRTALPVTREAQPPAVRPSLHGASGQSIASGRSQQAPHRHAAHAGLPLPHFVDPFPDHFLQQLIRTHDQHGRQAVEGLLRGTFAAGQRLVSLHVALCPPLDVRPEVEVEQLDGPPVSIKVASTMPYGLRLDLRLKNYSRQSESVLVALRAWEPAQD
jgi:hypothetical protein